MSSPPGVPYGEIPVFPVIWGDAIPSGWGEVIKLWLASMELPNDWEDGGNWKLLLPLLWLLVFGGTCGELRIALFIDELLPIPPVLPDMLGESWWNGWVEGGAIFIEDVIGLIFTRVVGTSAGAGPPNAGKTGVTFIVIGGGLLGAT
jgi:hypothetical protein